jgi:alpha-beta hydrolase superfamily lysophospholipase
MWASLKSGGLRRGALLQRHARALRRLAAGASLAAALGIVPGAAAQTAKPARHPVTSHAASTHGSAHDDASHPHVYLMRGLLNVFSLGMDQLAAQIARNGVDAGVYNHSVEETVVGTIVQKYRAGDHGPYILVGHSLGADAVMLMALQLNAQGVPVALVVPFDGTASYAAPANVSCVVNLTQRKYAYMQAGAGFHGKLSNVDVSSDTTIDHVTIDKSPRLQAMALKEILQAAHGQACRPGTAPAVAGAKQSAPKEIAPQDSGSKENATKDGTLNDSVTKDSAPKEALSPKNATPAKNAKTIPPAKTASPAKGATPAKSGAAPTAPAKNDTTPAKSTAPEKSAAAGGRAEPPIF